MYPGYSIENYFTAPAVYIPSRAGLTLTRNYSLGDIVYYHNSHGYRTHEFTDVANHHTLLLGCSLTYGSGLHHNDTYATKLENAIGEQVINLAAGGANAEFVKQNIWLWTKQFTPRQVIVQWPSIYRLSTYSDNECEFLMANNANEIFKNMLQHSRDNFKYRWLNAVLDTDRLLKMLNIPCHHIFFEPNDTAKEVLPFLEQYSILLHYDKKTEGDTWHFDSQALDDLHHSKECNSRWCERIMRLLK